MTAAGRIPRPTRRSAHQLVAGEAVLMHVAASKLLGLNESGTFVWGQVDGHRTIEEIAALLASRYGLEAETALADVERLIQKLVERDLVELA
jgi:hypothetical protein